MKKWKKGSALIFVFMLLILFAALTASMMEMSVASKNLSTTVVEVKEAQYYAEIGLGYVLRECNKINLGSADYAATQSAIPAFITGMIAKGKQPVGNGWFQVLSYSASDSLAVNMDFLVRLSGGVAHQAMGIPSRPSLSSFLDMAYAQGEVSAEYEVLIGPDYIGGSKGNMYFGDSGGGNPWSALTGTDRFTAYPGGQGYLVTQDPNLIPDASIGAGVTEKTMSSGMDVSAQTQAAITAANNLLDNYINWSTSTIIGVPGTDYTTISPSSSANFTVSATGGYSGTGQYKTSGNLSVAANKTGIVGDTGSNGTPIKMIVQGDITLGNNAVLRIGYGTYLTTGHDDVIMSNGSKLLMGDPTGVNFTVAVFDDLEMTGATLVLGPGIYAFSRVKGITTSSKIIMDTTNGPVYFVLRNMLHNPELDVRNSTEILTFKDNSVDCSTYEKRTDQANAANPLGPTGQKIGRIYMTSTNGTGFISFDNAGVIGGFSQGNQSALWNSYDDSWSNLGSGTYSEINTSNGNLKSPLPNGILGPTAGAFQIWAGSINNITMQNSADVVAAMQIAQIANITMKNTATIYGALSTGNITGTVTMLNSTGIKIDPNLNPFPPVVQPGTIHVKWKRKVN